MSICTQLINAEHWSPIHYQFIKIPVPHFMDISSFGVASQRCYLHPLRLPGSSQMLNPILHLSPLALCLVRKSDPGGVYGRSTQPWDCVVGRCCIVHLQFAGFVKDTLSNLDTFKDRVDEMVIGGVQIELVTFLMIAVCSVGMISHVMLPCYSHPCLLTLGEIFGILKYPRRIPCAQLALRAQLCELQLRFDNPFDVCQCQGMVLVGV